LLLQLWSTRWFLCKIFANNVFLKPHKNLKTSSYFSLITFCVPNTPLLCFFHLRFVSAGLYRAAILDFFSYTSFGSSSEIIVTVWRSHSNNFNVVQFFYRQTFPLPRLQHAVHSLRSSDKIFFSMWWLERELSEMVAFRFDFKLDDRNLLLEYTSTYAPMLRAFPSTGVIEFFYSSLLRFITIRRATLQSV